MTAFRLSVALLAASSPLSAAPENLLRNGSFEGSMLYWHNLAPKDYELVSGAGAATGETFLRLKSGFAMSAPFVAERGKWFTVSFFARGQGLVTAGMPPSAREVGTASKRLWTREAGQTGQLSAEWKRFSFSWPADVPTDGFWTRPHYLVQIQGENGKVIDVDGVTAIEGREGTAGYVPRREVEAVAACLNLPGYAGAAGNAFDAGATARMKACVSNPGGTSRAVTVRWQLIDYEGETPVSDPADTKITLAPGQTFTAETPIRLGHRGLVYARLSVWDDKGVMLDKSDFPLTSIPYPKAATKPDYRERFGGSFAGGEQMLQKYQRLGFGWTRWFPETKWQFFQKKAGAPFDWHDREFALSERHGVSQHVVLYGWPEGLMDKEHSGQPLPLDMKWGPEDPRWDDLSLETAWDRYVKAAVENFRGKSVIFEIENEPEFDKWEKHHTEYAKFNIRTARLIRAADPKAKIMVNNVYGVPSPVNAAFFRAGGLKHIDVVSWHDYHAGWLSDAQGIKRMRQNMDEAGGKDVELWFNEGWAFTNTAVDEPIACTHLTAAQSTNAHAASVAEMTVSGQAKTILFHTGYEDHGMSFWDYAGPGTCLWDWYDFPLPLVPMWNVLNHHIGLSETVGFVRPPGANFCVFQDIRNGRGVIVAYADRESKADATVELPFDGLLAEDLMGNVSSESKSLKLSKTGRVVLLYDGKTSGAEFLKKLESLDRKHQGFVDAGGATFKLPPTWEGTAKGESAGSVALADGRPVWMLEQLWPADWKQPGSFRPMVWTGTDWNVKEGGFGGQPGASLKDGVLGFGTRAPHGPDNDRHLRTAGLTFVASQAGTYRLGGTVSARMWDSKNTTNLLLLKRSAQAVEKVGSVAIPHGGEGSLDRVSVSLAAGEKLTLLPVIEGMFAGGDCQLKDLSVSLEGVGSASPVYRMASVWEGSEKGREIGNPLVFNGKPIWRALRLYPVDAIMTANYSPLVWGNQVWIAPDHSQGGHPSLKVEDGKVRMGALGPWGGNEQNYPKVPVLAFVAPADGVYRVSGTASVSPWDGGAKTFPLALRKMDTQRAAEVKLWQLPRDASPVKLEAEIELSAGHELLFVPMTHDLHNNAGTVTLEGLEIRQLPK